MDRFAAAAIEGSARSRRRRVNDDFRPSLYENVVQWIKNLSGAYLSGPARHSIAIAVGTQFDVYRTSPAIEFTVAQGEIAVFSGELSWLRNTEGLPPGVQRVAACYRLRIDADALPSQPVSVDLDQALGWVQHKIVFQRRPLGEIAAEFNRYGKIRVEIEDAPLLALPVSGTFYAADTESFVAFLERLPGVGVENTPARIRVLRIKPTT